MIRAIETGDREVWTRLWTGYLAFYETVLPEEVFATTWARLHNPAEPIWGALSIDDSGKAVGLVHFIYHRTAWAIAETCYLQDLFVDPDMRGGGHGRALIEYVAAEAGAKGAARLYWHTNEANATARRLYDTIAEYPGFIQYRMKV